jgi:alkanesulfonate monooxygenase SsuD/methylene tetrahydromethanopterin reductase-like flavin-dependent oxidoreductase (luciferase family)
MKRLIVLAVLVAVLIANTLIVLGCSSAETRDLAAKNRAHLVLVHKASAPKGVSQEAWDAAWAEAHRAAANLEGALK